MYRALLVGLGQIGCGYDAELDPATFMLTHARALSTHPAFALVGGVDPDAGNRSRFAAGYSAPSFSDLDEGIAATRPDVAIVAAPTPDHAALVKRLCRVDGIRSILCEKPLASSVAEGEEMLAACDARGCSIVVNYMRRSHPATRAVAARIASGEIAAPLKGIGWYSKGLLHNGSHLLELLIEWLGPVDSFKLISPGRKLANGDVEPDVWVQFRRGSVMFLATAEENFSHFEVELLAPNGRLRYSNGGRDVTWAPVVADPVFPGYRGLAAKPEVIVTDADRSQWHVAEQWGRFLSGEPASICSGSEALDVLASLMRIRDSI